MKWRFHPILHAAHVVEELVRRELEPLGLQPRQARILVTLAQSGPVSQADLARAFDVSRPSMTVMIERLLRDGLVEHHVTPDRQRPLVALSAPGAARVPAVEQAWTRVDDMLRQRLGAELLHALGDAALQARDALSGRAPHDILKKGQ